MNAIKQLIVLLLLAMIGFGAGCQKAERTEKRVLVFSKTDGYRHESIEAGIKAIKKLGAENGFAVDTTENATRFTEENLARYSAVIFLNTTHDVLDYRQQADFERYIQCGGGFVGIHAAADTEYDWPWYGKLVGAYFTSHPNNPNVQKGMMHVVDRKHISTSHLQEEWERTDEFYNFRDINPEIHPLIKIDESTYNGGTNGDDHPMSWFHEFDGGRSWYTNFGHTPESFTEPDFLQHLLGGIEYAIGPNLLPNYQLAKSLRVPPDNRFVMQVLAENLNEPTELQVMPDGRILFTGRRGELSLYEPEGKILRVVAKLNVHNGHEDGLMGMALDPKFADNHYLYLYYSPVGEVPVQYLSRFVFQGDSLDMASEKIVLKVPTQREQCCHTGGSIQFGADGLLYLSTGDNTNPFETAYSPSNELPGRSPWDAQKSSANTNDLRGKILRIRPTADGGYEIPEGNLFAKDGHQGRPEIYVMGCRNPYRISVDQKNGFVYWGEVGPDARVDSSRGPRGYDEVNQARKPGFFGWPLFVGNNYPYREVNFKDNSFMDFYDAAHPVNNSPNNTGAQELPPAQPAFIWYPYVASPEFPIVGEGGRNAMAGPVYYHDMFEGTSSQFPRYYDGKLLIYDFMRDWIFAVTMYPNGDLEKIEPFLPNLKLSSPVDMEFGPDGALYILEYGTQWFAQNADARLIRIDYSEGNRAPIAQIEADKKVGAVPLTVSFTADQSFDYDDNDQLTYSWTFSEGATAKGVSANHTFDKAGIYPVKLIVSDQSGASSETEMEIQVGNEPPKISIQLDGNSSFFWAERPLGYQVEVSDKEDGSLQAGTLSPEAVAISFSYLNNSEDATIQAQDHASLANASLIAAGKDMITSYGCIACHNLDKKIQGPSYREVSERYQDREDGVAYLVSKIRNGGSGIWGGNAMPAQIQVSEADAQKIAIYLLSLASATPPPPSLAPAGSLQMAQHQGVGEASRYMLQVSYQDRGGEIVGPLSAYEAINLRSPKVSMNEMDNDAAENVRMRTQRPEGFRFAAFQNDGLAVFRGFDLTAVAGLDLRFRTEQSGVIVEIRADSQDGPLLGTFSPQNTKGAFATDNVAFTAMKGVHDLYFIVKAPAEGEGAVMGLHWWYARPDLNNL